MEGFSTAYDQQSRVSATVFERTGMTRGLEPMYVRIGNRHDGEVIVPAFELVECLRALGVVS
jgi:hypothetical protein